VRCFEARTSLLPQAPSESAPEALKRLTLSALLSPIPRLYLSHPLWFLQLESCNCGSANPHGCVGHSELHDITQGAEC
jgi:hypothetical protein